MERKYIVIYISHVTTYFQDIFVRLHDQIQEKADMLMILFAAETSKIDPVKELY